MENLKQPSAQPNHEYVMGPDHSKWVWRAAVGLWITGLVVVFEENIRIALQKSQRTPAAIKKPFDPHKRANVSGATAIGDGQLNVDFLDDGKADSPKDGDMYEIFLKSCGQKDTKYQQKNP